jgi:putative heme-binding domain-containing protein
VRTDETWKGSKVGRQIELGSADNPFDLKKTFDAYNSWQLAKPGAQAVATPVSEMVVPPGFKVELIRSAQAGEDSWVAMAFDPSGRITLGKEKKGLLRLTLSGSGEQKLETIDDSLLECRGLVYAHGSLFANANNSKALFRLTDADGDGAFERKEELMTTGGGVGHGRNHIKLGPDGHIYIAHGNNVLLPDSMSPDSPLKHYREDQLIPNPWDGSMFDGNVMLPAGHVLRVSPDGKERVLLAGGLRNPLDIAFNREGALFTFDADMERDVGTHFYMPTRVLQIVPGADYGWRRGTGRWPAWYADTLPSVVDIGLSSPTAVFFGYGAAFPKRYQDALFICDWSYGRLIAVHLQKRGQSYVGVQETFASGRPLNVTDGAVGPDGALWFITGGRGTQSGLYRISYIVKEAEEPDVWFPHDSKADAVAIHERRMKWEEKPDQISLQWKPRPENIAACVAAVRVGSAEQRAEAVKIASVWMTEKKADIVLDALRIMEIAVARGHAMQMPKSLPSLFPAKDARVSREVCKWLVYFKWPETVRVACEHLSTRTTSEDLVFYPFILRYLKVGWTPKDYRVAFTALNQAEKLNGASTYFKVIADTRSELAAALSAEQALALADVIHPPTPAPLLPAALPGHSFKTWTVADVEPQLDKVKRGRSYDKARAALISTQCVFCHKVSNDRSLPAGVFGPDLVQVRSRFSSKDLLMHILQPSLVIDEKFKSVSLTKSDGSTVTGMMESEDDERITLKPNPLAAEVIETAKAQITKRTISDISPMPAGLLNTLKLDQILDLLAWFEAGGEASSSVWSDR